MTKPAMTSETKIVIFYPRIKYFRTSGAHPTSPKPIKITQIRHTPTSNSRAEITSLTTSSLLIFSFTNTNEHPEERSDQGFEEVG